MTRTISSSLEVGAPADFAISFLSTYLTKRAPGAAGSQMCLEVPLSALANSFVVQKMVDVDAHLARSADHHSSVIELSWRPEGEGPFPSFQGIVRSTSATATTSTLVIEGDYRAPGDLAGAVFDVAIGSSIANATLRRLLTTFRESIEADYVRRDG